MRKFRLVVFDLDGTLVDSLGDLAESANALLVESGSVPLGRDEIGRMVGEGAAVLVTKLFAAAALPQPPEALERFLEIYDARLLELTRPYAGIPEALAEMDRSAALAVLTNKPIGATRQILQGLDLARYFRPQAVLGGDGPLPRKPDAAGLRYLASQANVPLGETVLVGDSLVDWRTARAAGSAVCLARYGFGFESVPAGTLGPADLHVDSPAELVSVL